ncbi:MAG: DUF72 domain-containing protein [Thaumarchaeota archaeon]|jgi:uncharacterized protein YecE (DUF72 family)|nr:DUF72 domain-containing protein [Candidatus Geocrenenecus arthurdayi]MCL7388853.1 DUF72 domain-containing protein [Candidatus Geocrenenecus arthurdayi]
MVKNIRKSSLRDPEGRLVRMEYFVGTSGWFYSWNQDGSLDWFVRYSGLNAVELNMSFYRYPYPTMVRSWASKGKTLKWAIKVNRLITHVFKFNEKAYQLWKKFYSLFSPLDSYIDFYLFQLPPSMTPRAIQTIEDFVKRTGLNKRFALEVRNMKWYNENYVKWASKLNITWVSIDSPDFPTDIFNTNGIVYERMHGRTAWYSHYYTDQELKDVAERIKEASPEKVYVFFNNNHDMLENARRMLQILSV